MLADFSQNEGISHLAERRMREWQQPKPSSPADMKFQGEIDYITISREVGSGGREIAQILAELSGWGLYDKKILDFMAENSGIHKDVLASIDERARGWVEDSMAAFFSNKSTAYLDQLGYYENLVETLLVIARHGRAIIVGRAASHILPRKTGLSVRITAPFELRSRRHANQNNISIEDAATLVKKADREQSRFVKSFLDKDAFDTKYYDLVFNTEKFGTQSVAKLIWRALDQRVNSEQEQARAIGP